MPLLALVVTFLLAGCATRANQTDKLLQGNKTLPSSYRIEDVPFIKQKTNHCGPASLAMILDYHQRKVSLDELTSQMYTPLKEGTFQTDLITTARRQGMMVLPVSDVRSLLTEISQGNPVLVFQNLGLEKFPKWHFAVAFGYDLENAHILLHSGPKKHLSIDLRVFEHSWELAEFWGIVVLKPGQLSATADELAHVSSAASLERLGKYHEAEKSYLSIIQKWPTSLSAHMGLGNIHYAQNKYNEAVIYLTAATIKHPTSAMAWHNLALAQGAAQMIQEAYNSSRKALALVGPNELKTYEESLKDFLLVIK